MSIYQHAFSDNAEHIVNFKLKYMSSASEEALLDYFAAGHVPLLDRDGLRRLASRIGTNVRELKRLLNDFARTGNIEFSTLHGKPIAVPCNFEETA